MTKLEVSHGRGGERELFIRFNASDLEEADRDVGIMFACTPVGYRGERKTVARERGRRGRKMDCTVVLWQYDTSRPPLEPAEYMDWFGEEIG